MEVDHMREWDKLQVFYFVAKFGGITKAGQYLHVSQPSVSRTIRILEENLKTSLFERIARGVVLTKAGQILFDHVTKIMSELGAALKFIEGDEEQAEGKIKILTTHGAAYSWLVFFMPGFIESYPNIAPIINCKNNLWDMTQHDIAILPHVPGNADLVQLYLTTFQMRLYASPSYLEKFEMPKSIEDLSSHRLITYGSHSPNPPGSLSSIAKGRTGNYSYIEINSAQGRLHLAELGLGIAELGKDDRRIDISKLIEVLPEHKSPSMDIYYIYHKAMESSQRVMCLLNYLKSSLNKDV